jgi:hypothetical protein
MATAAQALGNDGFSPLSRVDSTRRAARHSAHDGSGQGVSIVVNLTQNGTGTSTKSSCAHGFPIELPLIAGKVLAGGEIALERRGGRTIEDRCVVGAAVGTGRQQDWKNGGEIDRFHWFFLGFREQD